MGEAYVGVRVIGKLGELVDRWSEDVQCTVGRRGKWSREMLVVWTRDIFWGVEGEDVCGRAAAGCGG